MRLEDHLREAMVRRSLVDDDGQADLHVARFKGQLAQKMGSGLAVSFAAYLRGNLPPGVSRDERDLDAIGFHDDARMAEYADALASRADGSRSGPVPFGDQGPFPAVADAVPPTYDAEGLDYDFDCFAEAAGRLMYADAWATRVEENGDGASLSGQDVLDLAPPTPREAVLEGAELGGRYEQAAGKGVGALHVEALVAHFGPEADLDELVTSEAHGRDRFAECLAFQAVGAGVGWGDDHSGFEPPQVRFEYHEEAGLPAPTDDDEPDEGAPRP